MSSILLFQVLPEKLERMISQCIGTLIVDPPLALPDLVKTGHSVVLSVYSYNEVATGYAHMQSCDSHMQHFAYHNIYILYAQFYTQANLRAMKKILI